MRLTALFTRPLAANAADMIASAPASGNGAAISGVTLLPMPIGGARPVRPVDRVLVEQNEVRATDKAEVFVIAPKDGAAATGELGVILGYGKTDGLDLSRLGRFTVLETTRVDNVHADHAHRIAPEAGRRLSLDLDADGKEDAHLLVSGDGYLPPAIKDLPVEPPGGWRTNMPIPPGGPAPGLVRPIEGELNPVIVPGSPGDGQFHILPYPMPDTAPGEATILPFPLPAAPIPGQPVSFASWGSWIGF